MSEAYRLWKKPEPQSSSLIVAWNRDMSGLGARVAGYLSTRLAAESFAEIEPVDFFPLSGVAVENDVAQFPESKFYWCPGNSLVVFVSDPPNYKWFEFLNLLLDIGQRYCRVTELYTIGGLVSTAAHTAPRTLLAAFSSPDFKAALSQYSLSAELDYDTPSGQRPTLNSYLLWLARQKGIPGVCVWASIPFYLLAVGDPQAERSVIDFFDRRFDLHMDFSQLDGEVKSQNEQIARVRNDFPEIDRLISKLEGNLSLSETENEQLVKQITESVGGRGLKAESI